MLDTGRTVDFFPQPYPYSVCEASPLRNPSATLSRFSALILDLQSDAGSYCAFHSSSPQELSSQLEVLPDESGLNRIFNMTHEALRLRAADSHFDLRDSGTTLTICFIDNADLCLSQDVGK